MKIQDWLKRALILGAVFFIAALVVKPVGVSTQYSVLSGMIHSTIDPDVITEDPDSPTGYQSSNEYYNKSDGKFAKSIKNPINYDFVFVLAIPLGAWVAYMVTNLRNKGKKGKQDIADTTVNNTCNLNQKRGKVNRFSGYVPYFIGGFLLLYGARMADGCTSGHMMSGMMQGSISGYLFAACVFAVAIPTAIIIGNRINGGKK